MTKDDLIGCIAVGAGMIVVIALSVVLMRGKGAWLIAGYNTMDQKEKDRYDSTALCKFMGKYLLSVSLLMPVIPIGGMFKINWLGFVYGAYVLLSAIFVIVYCNTGNRFKKQTGKEGGSYDAPA